MPIFEHRATYPHPRPEVFAWHERPGAFTRLTPPGSATQVHGPTDGIRDGSRLEIRLSTPVLEALWPQRLRLAGRSLKPGVAWHIVHSGYEPGTRFVDEQVSGPMSLWRHEHDFADAPDGATTVTDRVTWELPAALQRGGGNRLVRRYLEGLFRFREDQLRADLDLHARLSGTPQVIAVSGASGTIGTQLCALLTTGGHTVRRLVRRESADVDEISWDPALGDLDPAALADVDTVVNLSGRSIGGRFTETAKQEILWSRVDSTTTLAQAITAARREGTGPSTLVQASAIGLYGAQRPGETLDEWSPHGEGFLAEVVHQWEEAAERVEEHGVRLVRVRTGIVLDAAAGALALQLPLYLMGVGGRLTAPDAMMSWITLDDMARLYATAVLDPQWSGAVNAVAPEPVSARTFASRLGSVLHRPSLLPTPSFGPRLVLGREGAAELVETDQRVSSERAQTLGFQFAHPDLETALRHVLAR